MQVCRDHFGEELEGQRQIKVWVEISREFEKRSGRTYSFQSCARRFKDCVKKEKTRIAMNRKSCDSTELPASPASRFVNEWIISSQSENREYWSMIKQKRQNEAQALVEIATRGVQRDERWEERMNGWVQSSTDPRFFSGETTAVINDVSVGGPLVSSDPVVGGDNHPPAATSPAQPVTQNDIKVLNDKIDRVAENILNSMNMLLKDLQLQQRREMKEFQARILMQMREDNDLVSQNLFDAQKDIQDEGVNHLSTLSNDIHNLRMSVLKGDNNVMKLRREILDAIDTFLADQRQSKK